MVFYLPYKSIRHISLDERKIIILNQSIENNITKKCQDLEHLKTVYIKTLWLALSLVLSLFIGLSGEYLYLLKDQKTLMSSISIQKNKQNTTNFISIDNVLVLTYEEKSEKKTVYLDKKVNEYRVLAKVQMQLEMDNYEMLNQVKDQKQYIKDMMAVILSGMTYRKILQEKSQVTLKINIKNKINKFLSRGKIKDIHNINIINL